MYYYLTDSENNHYSASIKDGRNILPFLDTGDEVVITYSEGTIGQIATIKHPEDQE